MSESDKEEPTVKEESEMEVEDNHQVKKEERNNKKKIIISIIIIIIISLIAIGLLIALIIVAVKNSSSSSSSSSNEYTQLYVSNEKKGKGDCTTSNKACDSIKEAYNKISSEGDCYIYVISDTLNAEKEEIEIIKSVTITKVSESSSSSHKNEDNNSNNITLTVSEIDKEGEKKSLISMSERSRVLNINYLSFELEQNELKPTKPVISMGGGNLSLFSCSFVRVKDASDALTSSIIEMNKGNCIINSCSFTGLIKEEGDGSAINAILTLGCSLNITSTDINKCITNNGNGGGVYISNEYGSSVDINNVRFIGCESKKGDGGGIYLDVKDEGKVIIGEKEGQTCSFIGCKAGFKEDEVEQIQKGGGIYIKINNSKNIIINNINFTSSSSTTETEDDEDVNYAKYGKYMFVESDVWNYSIINTMFPIIAKEGKDNKDNIEGMKIKEGENNEIVDLYGVAFPQEDDETSFTLTFEASQINESNIINVKWDTSKKIDKIIIEVVRDDKILHSFSCSDNTFILFRNSTDIEGIYGKQNVRVIGIKGEFQSIQNKEVIIKAKKYIIAPLAASVPVTIFTMEMTKNTNNFAIPTMIWLERYETYDWTSLPPNFYLIPTFKEGEIEDKTILTGYERTAEYVKELHECDPTSTFELYINDVHVYGALHIIYAHNLKSLFKIHLLSDGAGSDVILKTVFNDPTKNDENYEKIKNQWIRLRDSIITNKKYERGIPGYIYPWDFRLNLMALIGEETDVDWVILSSLESILGEESAAWFNKYTEGANPKIRHGKNLGDIFKTLTEDEKENMESVLHMSSSFSAFETAAEQNKNIHCIVGASQGEGNLEYLLKCTQELVKEEYLVYYKGHPASPTYKNQSKIEMLERINVLDVDSSVPFELIYCFNNQMMVSGYQSSVFTSLSLDSIVYLYDQRMEDALKETNEALSYKKKFKGYITKLNNNDSVYGSLYRGNNPMLVQFNTDEGKVAVYDPDDNSIIYYKKKVNGSGFDVIENQ